MALGLALVFLQPSGFHPPASNPPLKELLSSLVAHPFDPSTIMYLGLVCLMFTPVLRVCTAVFSFAAEKDWKFVLVSTVIFLMLAGEIVFSSR